MIPFDFDVVGFVSLVPPCRALDLDVSCVHTVLLMWYRSEGA